MMVWKEFFRLNKLKFIIFLIIVVLGRTLFSIFFDSAKDIQIIGIIFFPFGKILSYVYLPIITSSGAELFALSWNYIVSSIALFIDLLWQYTISCSIVFLINKIR